MRILVLGGDGYLGWPTALHLSDRGHEVAVLDNGLRRDIDRELGTCSLVPIACLKTRSRRWMSLSGRQIEVFEGDLTADGVASDVLRRFRPEAVVHFAEQRSAPYSMIDRAHAVFTQTNNVIGTLELLFAIARTDPDIHLVKLGSMGEYGTPNVTIEEGWLDVHHDGRSDRMLYPKRPGSFYHLSKVHDSHNIEFACRTWGIRATDLNQGIVYGQETRQTAGDPLLATRFDYDGVFGTVLNRFVVQAASGLPLTVYGSGRQTRGLIDIRDTVECIRLACEHAPERGEFRVFNQMTEAWSVSALAELVAECCGPSATIQPCDNPRVESEDHYFRARHTKLENLGLQPHHLSHRLIESMLAAAGRHRARLRQDHIAPTVRWAMHPSEIPETTSSRDPELV